MADTEIMLARHGETEWSRDLRHTGHTDIPLTDTGREQARALATRFSDLELAFVLTSPLSRATESCRLAGLGDQAVEEPDLVEWDYGEYEGMTTEEIRRDVPGWTVWDGAAPGGEDADQVGARADRVIARVREADGPGDQAQAKGERRAHDQDGEEVAALLVAAEREVARRRIETADRQRVGFARIHDHPANNHEQEQDEQEGQTNQQRTVATQVPGDGRCPFGERAPPPLLDRCSFLYRNAHRQAFW